MKAPSPLFRRFDIPFTHFVADNVLDSETIRELNAQFPPVHALTRRVRSMPGGDKQYAMDFAALVVCDCETPAVNLLPDAWQDLCRMLAHRNFRDTVAVGTGVDVRPDHAEIGVYVHREGDGVSVHRDKPNKTMSCILYLNQEWQESAGGDFLLFSGGDLDFPARSLAPVGGRLIAFAPSGDSWHGVSPVRTVGGLRRTMQIEFTPRDRDHA